MAEVRMPREAWAVVDLGFGDAGKGSVTDFLCRDRGADLVVRFNGGAQAGHNVITPGGRHHTFAQLCAGTLAGVPGLLGPDFLLHPLGLAVEVEHLERAGVRHPWALLEVDRRARVITPYQQAANRERERLRGADAHGTCGVGVGECVADALAHPDEVIRVGDLGDGARLRRRLCAQRDRKRAELVALGADIGIFDDDGLVDRVVAAWAGVASRLRVLDGDAVRARIDGAASVVFEGAQGVLLDETWGFHPHTTWSDCTFRGALALAGDRAVTRLGVTRAYAVRHGPGPFPTDGTVRVAEAHNDDAGWQGRFRTGALDGVLLRYAAEVCGGVDAVALTCVDRLDDEVVCDGYAGPAPDGLARRDAGSVRVLVPGDVADLAHRERLGRWLGGVEPLLERADPAELVARAVGAAVRVVSVGPRATDKRWI